MKDGENMTQINSVTITDAQRERLAYLAEECAEVIQACAKIMRHGFDSYDPTNPNVIKADDGSFSPNNANDLEKELGHIFVGIQMLKNTGDINSENVFNAKSDKLTKIGKYLYHQPPEALQNT